MTAVIPRKLLQQDTKRSCHAPGGLWSLMLAGAPRLCLECLSRRTAACDITITVLVKVYKVTDVIQGGVQGSKCLPGGRNSEHRSLAALHELHRLHLFGTTSQADSGTYGDVVTIADRLATELLRLFSRTLHRQVHVKSDKCRWRQR